MAAPDGYVLSEKDILLLRSVINKFKRLQHYTNAFGRPPDNTIDNEEMPSTDVYIAHTPVGGIPGLTLMGSTGIGDVPGKATCTIFKVRADADETEDVTGYEQEIYNLNTSPIEENQWIIVVRDKYGKWYALSPAFASATPAATLIGPGWTAGLSNEDCLMLSVTEVLGKCSTIDDTQTILLSSLDALSWTNLTTNFVYSGGTGAVVFTRPSGSALPTLKIGSYDLIYEGSGRDSNGLCYIEYKGGTTLCSDVPGTGSGTGGARGECCSNTFTVRLTCAQCVTGILVTCCEAERPEGINETLFASLTSGLGTVTLTWDGTYWQGSIFIAAGLVCAVDTTLMLRYTTGCQLQYSCNGGINWNTATAGTITCGPPFTSIGHNIFSGVKVGCAECLTTITADISE